MFFAVALPLGTGCAGVSTAEFFYISFEETPEANIEAVASPEIKYLIGEEEIPVEYSLRRDEYTIRLNVDHRKFAPNVTIHLLGPTGAQLIPQPSRGARAGRPRPCGSYEELPISETALRFTWVICGRRADLEEFVVAFDVVGIDDAARSEILPFALKTTGMYVAPDGP